MSSQNSKHKKAWLGIFLVSLGGYFLLRNLGLIPSFIPWYLFGWEMVFILIGGSMLITGKREGIIFLAIGGLSILPDIFYWWPHYSIRDMWPIVLIIIGASIIMRRKDHKSTPKDEKEDDFLNENVVFGGLEKTFNSQNFKGGKITLVFGETNIDLTKAQMASEEVTLDVFCLFGGNTITVPNDWTVVNKSFITFGAYEDQRSPNSIQENDPNKVLRIKGSVVFGGAKIKGV